LGRNWFLVWSFEAFAELAVEGYIKRIIDHFLWLISFVWLSELLLVFFDHTLKVLSFVINFHTRYYQIFSVRWCVIDASLLIHQDVHIRQDRLQRSGTRHLRLRGRLEHFPEVHFLWTFSSNSAFIASFSMISGRRRSWFNLSKSILSNKLIAKVKRLVNSNSFVRELLQADFIVS